MVKSKVLICQLLVIAVIGFAGGQQEASTAEGVKKEVSIIFHGAFIGDAESAWMKPQCRTFEAANPGIKVVSSGYGSPEVQTKFINSMIAGDNAYDLVMIRAEWTPDFASSGWLWEIPKNKIPNVDDYLALESVMVGEKWYGIPTIHNLTLFSYNKKFLGEAGMVIPETVDEWLDMNPKLTQDTNGDGKVDIWGTVLEGTANQCYVYFEQFLYEFGGKFFTKKGDKYIIDWVNSPEARAAVQLMIDLYHSPGTDPGAFTYSSDEAMELFVAGKAVFANLNSGKADRLEFTAPGKPLHNANGSTIFPGAIGSKRYPVSNPRRSSALSGSQGLGIAANSKVKEEALKLAIWFSEPENQIEMIEKRGYSVVRKSMASDTDFINQHEYILAVQEQGEYIAPRMAYRNAAVEIVMIPIMESARAEKISIEDALKEAQEKVMKVLNE